MKMMGSGTLILQNQAGIFMLLPKFSSKNGSKNICELKTFLIRFIPRPSPFHRIMIFQPLKRGQGQNWLGGG